MASRTVQRPEKARLPGWLTAPITEIGRERNSEIRTATEARCMYFASSRALRIWAVSEAVLPVTGTLPKGGKSIVPSSSTRRGPFSVSSSNTLISSRSRGPTLYPGGSRSCASAGARKAHRARITGTRTAIFFIAQLLPLSAMVLQETGRGLLPPSQQRHRRPHRGVGAVGARQVGVELGAHRGDLQVDGPPHVDGELAAERVDVLAPRRRRRGKRGVVVRPRLGEYAELGLPDDPQKHRHPHPLVAQVGVAGGERVEEVAVAVDREGEAPGRRPPDRRPAGHAVERHERRALPGFE